MTKERGGLEDNMHYTTGNKCLVDYSFASRPLEFYLTAKTVSTSKPGSGLVKLEVSTRGNNIRVEEESNL